MTNPKYDLFTLQQEDFKFHAFFQYLRSFSQTALTTLGKLQNDFTKQIRKKISQHQSLAVFKNILSAYQIFALQIKDSCDFVQLSQFGACISKTFLQLTKIIKWFLRSWIKNSGSQKKADEQKWNLNDKGPTLCSFCQEIIRNNPYAKDSKGKRKGVAVFDIQSDMKEAKMIHRDQMNHLFELKGQVIERYTQKEIESRRFIIEEMDILNRKHIALKMQISNNETVLEEILNQFSVKTEAIARFLTSNQAACYQDSRITSEFDYSHFQYELKQLINEKFLQAKLRLKELVDLKMAQIQRLRKENLICAQTQTQRLVDNQKERYQSKIRALNDQVKKLKTQVMSSQEIAKQLQQMLANKSIQFQQQFINYRKQVIAQSKNKNYLKRFTNYSSSIMQQKSQDAIQEDKQQNQQENQVRRPMFKMLNCKMTTRRIPSNLHSYVQGSQIGIRNSQELSIKNHQFEVFEPSDKQVQTQMLTYQQIGVCTQVTLDGIIFSRKQKPRKTQLYSHVQSRVFRHFNEGGPKSNKQKQNRSAYNIGMIKKLTSDPNLYVPQQSQPVACYAMIQSPVYSLTIQYSPTKKDILNLFLNDKNTQVYQNLICNNSIRNIQTPKRLINFCEKKEKQTYNIAWDNNQDVQSKVTKSLYKQLNSFKRKDSRTYQQIKYLFNSPWEVSQNLDVIHLENLPVQKEIDYGQFKKMITLIMNFHQECTCCEKDKVCQHLVDFSSRIGVRLI